MKNLLLSIAGACVAMLATSGVVAYATAKSNATAVASLTDEQIEERISELLDAQYRAVLARR